MKTKLGSNARRRLRQHSSLAASNHGKCLNDAKQDQGQSKTERRDSSKGVTPTTSLANGSLNDRNRGGSGRRRCNGGPKERNKDDM